MFYITGFQNHSFAHVHLLFIHLFLRACELFTALLIFIYSDKSSESKCSQYIEGVLIALHHVSIATAKCVDNVPCDLTLEMLRVSFR